jgi:pilus assembly protein FimV
MESRLQPDSFFGASGGQKIDTNEAALSGSSMIYSPSQLDAGADVDPVAEADVYLAYGRDLQAEEILKEALRSNPSRAAIHFKLLQIYAKRRDVKGYAVTAADAYKLSNGLGSDWTQACEVGRELDPTNPLYQGDMASNIPALPGNDEPPDAGADSIFATTNINPPSLDAPQATPAVDLDRCGGIPGVWGVKQHGVVANQSTGSPVGFDHQIQIGFIDCAFAGELQVRSPIWSALEVNPHV